MAKRSSKSSTRRHTAVATKPRKMAKKVARKGIAKPVTFTTKGGAGGAGKHVYYFGATRTEEKKIVKIWAR